MQINTNTFIIHGKQGGGKTLFSTFLALHRKSRIISNFRIYEQVDAKKPPKQINAFLDNMDTLNYFKYDPNPGIILFDEVGLNFNSKEHGSDKNKELSKFFFLVRKYNLSSVFISQRFNSVPVDMRELSDYIFEVSQVPQKRGHPFFRITRQTVNNEGFLEYYDERIFDLISYLQKYKITYNTLEASIIKTNPSKNEKKKKNTKKVQNL